MIVAARTPLAAKLCATPDFVKNGKCDRMSEDEYTATYGQYSIYSGTANYEMPQARRLPTQLDVGSAFVLYKAPFSLAC